MAINMNVKQKTACIALSLNFVLTVLKFLIYSFTGSLAILAEAWHSLTDILTSILVLIAVAPHRREASPGTDVAPSEPAARAYSALGALKTLSFKRGAASTGPTGGTWSMLAAWKRLSLEKRVSFFIGLFVLAAVFSIVRKVLIAPSRDIPNPFLSGLCFLLFAMGSYIVSRFEVKIGREQNSAGLIADGLHSKTDMVGSLIAGFAMIILHFGINVDKPAAIVISILVFSFAAEILLNVFAAGKGEEKWQDRITISLMAACLEKNAWSKASAWATERLNLKRIPPRAARIAKTSVALLLLIMGVIILAANCCFVVEPSCQAIRERMGKPLDWGRPLEPGLHLKLPWPLERAIKIESRAIRSMNVGNSPSPRTTALLWTVRHGEEEGFLSGDNEYFCPYLVLHYRIKNIFAYVYHYERPEEILDHSATRLICDIFCRKGFYEIVTGYRGIMEEEMQRKLQEEMDALKTGLEIISVNARDIHPPVSLADSFEQVIAAIQDKDKMLNQAIGYRNEAIPAARGEAVRTISEAQAYVDNCINQASGEADSFTNKYSAFRKNRSTTAKRIYLQTMSEALANRKLILIDPASGVPEIWTGLGNVPPSQRRMME